ncbi:exported protein of unknown function [Candidatus Filomicrobium marinum]|uniref:Uncharacterized protein n=2 Tax=Candidatus Filomicrobium marinum TaxID=1608628 RepID=A0A0D6JAJ4_9HYPH|nr:hypothetical protein [Candidatus Filomicrobium marinum]CFX02862.1 exported protein of unknown function [Candidatus Filomicrobium marinum]CPR15736.1 exported protein of unknown function [Candidatus Filomicrobium marinum]
MVWMARFAGAIALMMAGLPSVGALASSVTNNDAEDRQITIIEDNQQNQISLKPGERIDGVCLKGCILRLEGVEDGQYILVEGTEIVSIEDSVLFYDGAEKRRNEDGESEPPTK